MRLPAFITHPAVRALCAAAVFLPAGAFAADLSLSVADGPAADATLYVALYNDAAGYAESKAVASQTAPMQGGKARLVFAGLAPGRYAVRAFADENGNGKLDTNLLGMPTERYGFSNDAKGNRAPPSFDAAAINVDADLQTVIHLH
ncbi:MULTISPECIES: DUF2141 domain-containing protein [unclassified Variovorax]|jgi:uncharacterized protein (DUF2141 family)|uniref:DUF2141 domain-containing protein n=1 Tax=unclassified Variovorax TaxID=663243 RepID=UPI000F7EF2AE|nr:MULTISPECIES: DUF2141 domain-containing protein [unclassified Variovorax]RSZ47417.1 DUF2141 domain-containing protein [Variovorax sp. 553]RSZ48458.1 DUF2141 domain-containing protein [Variovorax sp. 679]